jgi:aminopeptidase YwaD
MKPRCSVTRRHPPVLAAAAFVFLTFVAFARPSARQLPPTPLPQETLDLLANELSGQMAFNNLVKLAGAPWLRDPAEFAGTFYESQTLYDLVRSYGIETVRLDRHPSTRTFDYPHEGELWMMEPEKRLIARLGADSALVGGGSRTADVTGELIYLPPMTDEDVKAMLAAGPQDRYRGKLALMWSHVRGDAARALDAAGIAGVIAFSSRDRYLDPNEVVYSSGGYADTRNVKLALNVSWRQWSELFEDLQLGKKVVMRGRARVETYKDRFDTVFAWIPGTEPDAKGVVFTGHLYEGYVKRGANDDMGGPMIELEILRGLSKLIADGTLPRPRRSIYFLWPNEISGTYEFIRQNPGFADKLSININMDMVSEALRKNNAVFTLSECPNHLPCYLDGLSKSMFDYVWRTNDIVYLPDSPRGRPGGQYFPKPLLEKNGSTDAFRYFIHRATGGSDHICFNNPSVAVPGVEYFVWPDQWYHADTDNPDKADPTEMRRVAFLGAAAAWTAANLTDEALPGLVDAVSAFGYWRVAERELPRALAMVEAADAAGLVAATGRARDLVDFAADRETAALRSIEDVYSGTAAAKRILANRVRQWELYRTALRSQVLGYAGVKAAQLGVKGPLEPAVDPASKQYDGVVPAIHPDVKGREFALNAHDSYTAYLKAHPDALESLGLTPATAGAVLNYVNGRRSVTLIRRNVVAETGQDVTLAGVAGYLEILRTAGWVTY